MLCILLRVQRESARLTPSWGRKRLHGGMKINSNHLSSALRLALLLLSAALLGLGSAHAQEAKADGHGELDAEHIFGFTEGAPIGEKGEKEIENTFVERFGKPGRYSVFENETAFRYVTSDSLRFSIGTLLNGYAVQDTYGHAGRAGFGFEGMTGEVRWQPLERSKSLPVDLTLSFSPQWRRVDDLGAGVETYSAETAILVDAALVPDKLFLGFNLIYEPSITRLSEAWQNESSLEVSLAVAYAIAPEVFAGAEIRRLSSSEQGLFTAQALFAGPSLYYKLTDTFAMKWAFSAQIPDATSHRLDLANFERYQALLLLVKSF